jgi:Tfp pilus assembly protein PilX
MSLIRTFFRNAADERGMTMATVMGVLFIGGLLVAAAVAAPNGDTRLSRYDQDYKDGYAAAEAGVAEYVFHLTQDNGYWVRCAGTVASPLPTPNAVNQPWNGSGADPRRWRQVPGTAGTNARNLYAIELIPENGYTQCDPNNPTASMIDDATGTFRIRATGCANSKSITTCLGGAKRSIIVTFKRRGFLDYLYFTDYETSDPAWYAVYSKGRATQPDIVSWAASTCATAYWRQNRSSFDYNGQIWNSSTSSWDTYPNNSGTYPDNCSEIQFPSQDVLAGPVHTNDSILVCGSPDFGRTSADRIEVSAPPVGWRGCGTGGSPNFIGQWSPNSPLLTLPPSETSLKTKTDAGYVFTGRTTIVLGTTSFTVTNAAAGLTNAVKSYPPEGIVYVQNGSCGQGYKPLDPYNNATGCADVIVRGAYGKDLTISAEKDIIINDDITRTGDQMLGLISNNFIRIYHPVVNRGTGDNGDDCDNATSASGAANLPYGNPPGSIEVDAALLSLQHSFTVDNYYCGAPTGTLSVEGAIAQKYRGPVGKGSGSSASNGYIKDYSYDDRLRFRSPPHFLDPVETAWRVMRQTEQTPAR